MSNIINAANMTERIFANAQGNFKAVVETTQDGIIAGLEFVKRDMTPAPSGDWKILVKEGQRIKAGDTLIEIIGTAAQIGIAEDYIMGPLGFASGIAMRASEFKAACPEGLSIACGGWKKLPFALKPLLRAGLKVVGVLPRLVDHDFVYMGKNSIIMLGSVENAIRAGLAVDNGPVAVQVKSLDETLFAIKTGAEIIMVDTANIDDLRAINTALIEMGLRKNIKLAFGGGANIDDLVPAFEAGANAIDVGRAILSAPLLDLRLRVLGAFNETI